jgi:hypothetical protein
VGQFRSEAAAHPTDQRFTAIAHELSSVSEEFRHWWSSHEVVRAAGGAQSFRHPAVGVLSTHLMQLRLIERPSLKLIIHHPSTDSDLRKLDQIRGSARWDAKVSSAGQ